MSDAFKITIEGLPDIKGVDLMKALNIPKIAEEELNNARARMISGLQSGRAPDGSGFDPYSAGYVKQILAGKIRGKSSTTVNLQATTQMVQSIQTKPTKDGAESFAQGQRRSSETKNPRVLKRTGKIQYLKGKQSGSQKKRSRKRGEPSNAEVLAAVDKTRPFFGLGPKDTAALEKRIGVEVERVLNDLFKK